VVNFEFLEKIHKKNIFHYFSKYFIAIVQKFIKEEERQLL